MSNTLVQRAKRVRMKIGRKYDKQEIDLSLAWLTKEVRLTQVAAILYPKTEDVSNTLRRLAVLLKQAYQQGKLKVKKSGR